MMSIQKLMNEMGYAAFDHITKHQKIKIREERSEAGHHLMALNYDQIDSPKFDPIVRECRGLIVDPNALVVVSRAFDRFFNYGEGGENDSFDISRSVVMEKVDGSLMKLYFYGGEWHVSTRGTCFAEVPVGAHDILFKDLFWRAAGVCSEEQKQKFVSNFHTNLTYIFEVATPENRVVTRYGEDQLVLLGVRSPSTGFYKTLEYKENVVQRVREAGFNIRLPLMFASNSFEEIVEATKRLDNLQEGFVAWDMTSDERIKFKSVAYVAVHHLRGEGALVPKRIAQLVIINEHEEYLTYFEEDRRFFEPYIQAFDQLKAEMSQAYERAKTLESQKDFALEVKDLPFSAVMFLARKNNVGVEEAWASIPDNKKIDLLLNAVKEKV